MEEENKEMKFEIGRDKIFDIREGLEYFENLLTERISDLHKIQGGIQARHAYIFYRKELQGIKSLLFDNLNLVEEKDSSVEGTSESNVSKVFLIKHWGYKNVEACVDQLDTTFTAFSNKKAATGYILKQIAGNDFNITTDNVYHHFDGKCGHNYEVIELELNPL
jgi:hypothetical protein